MARVLLFIDNFDQGGSQGQLVQLANGLEQDPEFQVRIGCLARRGPLLSQLQVPGDRVVEFPLNRFYDARGIWQIASVSREVARHRIDLVHSLDFYANMICSAAAGWDPRTRLVVSRRYLFLSDRWLHRVGERWSYRLADAVVMNSTSVAREIERTGIVSPAKVVIIPNGIDLSRFEAPFPTLPGPRRAASMRIGVVARLCRDKGLEVMIEAFARLTHRWPDSELVIVGDGESRDGLEILIDNLGIGERVTLAGSQEDVRPWIATFDVAVLPSRREGLPNTLLEYLAMGKAVVATRVGGVPDVIPDESTALLVPPENPGALAAAIDRLLKDPELRAALGEAAARRANAFSLERMVETTRALYRRLLNTAQRPDPIPTP